MTLEEKVNNRLLELAECDFYGDEINGLRAIIEELMGERRLPLGRFYADTPGVEMRLDDTVFILKWADVVGRAEEHSTWGERTPLPTDLSSDEMHVFRKCLESGLDCWSQVVELALAAATSERRGT